MTKVTLPKDVADAIESLRRLGSDNRDIISSANGGRVGTNSSIINMYVKDNEENFEVLLSALVNGYVVEKSPEDKMLEYYENIRELVTKFDEPYDNGIVDGIKFTLDTLGIKTERVNA